RPGAAGIELEDAVPMPYNGLVRMAGDDRIETGGGRVEVERVDVMDDIEEAAFDLEDRGIGKRVGPLVDIAANGRKRRQRLEAAKHLRFADVPRVHDRIAAGQGGRGLRPEQPVRVRDDADDPGHACSLPDVFTAVPATRMSRSARHRCL